MKILLNSNVTAANKLSPSKLVNLLGRYLYNHIDSAYKREQSSNMCDVYFYVLYQLKEANRVSGKTDDDLQEMHVNLNITTYQNKIRINLITIAPEATVLGYDLYTSEELEDLPKAYERVVQRLHKRLNRAYTDYDFLY